MTIYRNHYRHDDCGTQPGIEWDDYWSATCNDRCPACDAEIEPLKSEEIAVQGEGETSQRHSASAGTAPGIAEHADAGFLHLARVCIRTAGGPTARPDSEVMSALIDNNLRVELALSTCHIHWATDRTLANPRSELFNAVAVLDYQGSGWLLPVTDEAVTECERLGFEDLARTLALASRVGASHLRFDEGAPQLPEQLGLPEYDWDQESASAGR